VEGDLVVLRVQEVLSDGRRERPQVGDVDPGGREAGDHRALDHPVRGGGFAARDDPVAAFERRTERGPEPDRGLGREIDVDEAVDAVLAEEPRRRPRLPDQALMQL